MRVHLYGCYQQRLAFLFVPLGVWVGTWERVHVCIVMVVCVYVGEGDSAHMCAGGVSACKFVEFFSFTYY